jgi:hypothetical protein
MTEQMFALARRAVACKGWRWMPGMRGELSSGLVVRLGPPDEGSLWYAVLAGGATCTVDMRHRSYTVTPDLSDPATRGCLLALVREAWKDPALCALRELCGDWCWSVGRGEVATALRGQAATTEAEALVAALEAAP